MKKLKIGQKVFFKEEKAGYTVKAVSERYAILTKPYKSTVIYTILDLKEKIRGTNNLVFNIYDYKKQEDIDKCMEDLNRDILDADAARLSTRNHIPIKITMITEL